ncbi:glycerate kinase [Alicyclobacillus tolerans]|uniref:glycerate kinase n=1 Tax=Alicyclobacillus tolerans TaxID=90970 RepID=UPI001F32051D|nr:glycerate kinase [Alicyclobacillus tolerans]MCF8563953.1 glycerate kinase [Alicyclobacillus tolerans]
MKIVVAPDSFKGSLSAREVTRTMVQAVQRVIPDCRIDEVPIADGGEGTVDCLVAATGGQIVKVPVRDPLGRTVDGSYGLLPDGTCVIEVAAAAGLTMVKDAERDILRQSSYGVGQLIAHALEAGHTSFVVGLGGSATNDAGAGMLEALGVRFFDALHQSVPGTPEGLLNLQSVDLTGIHPGLAQAEIRVACDVNNPLCGPNGASAIFGPQKGATEELIPVLDRALDRFAGVVESQTGTAFREMEGAGAAGGLGGAFAGVLGAKLIQGIDLVLDVVDFNRRLQGADLVLTGEGRTDGQTMQGKAVFGIGRRAREASVPVFCISGAVTPDARALYDLGVTALFAIPNGPLSLPECLDRAGELLADAVESAVRAFVAGHSS